MKNILLCFTLTLAMACGGGASSNSSPTSVDSIQSGQLSVAETQLKQLLLEQATMEQSKLAQTLAEFNMNPSALKKLDRTLHVECSESSGLCHFSLKENL